MTIGLSLFNHLEHFFRTTDKSFSCSFDINYFVFVFMNSEVHLRCCKYKS